MTSVHDERKCKQFESSIGPLLSSWSSSFKFDDFQLTLFDLISNASDYGIQQYFQSKSNDINKFILTLFIASMHQNNPLRLINDDDDDDDLKLSHLSPTKNTNVKHNKLKQDNPLSSILVTPSHTLPPPPKRRNSDIKSNQNKQITNENENENENDHINDNVFLERNLSNIDESKEKDMNKVITPFTSSDKLISNKNKNCFDDILLSDNDNDNDFSKTYESYDGDEFFAIRTTTTRDHTTTEKKK
eukprot:110496_1